MKPKSIIDFTIRHFKAILIVYLVVQVILVFIYPLVYRSDSAYYWRLAQDCLAHSSVYPAPMHLYEDYIVAPLYINLLVVVLSVFNSKITIGILNIFLNFGQLFFVYKITGKLAGERSAKIAAVIYIFYLSSLGLILINLTELLFNLLIFASISYYLNKKNSSYFISGIFLAASIAVRPIGWALLAAFIIDGLFLVKREKILFKNIAPIIAGFLLFISLFGMFTYNNFGRFIFTSTTGPVNLIMGANDDATGAYNARVFQPGKAGFIPQSGAKTYMEKEEFWYGQAVGWIKKHPAIYLSLFPVKPVHIFAWDDFSVHKLLNFNDWDLYRAAKYLLIKKESGEFLGPGHSIIARISFIATLALHHLYYFLLLFLFMAAAYKYRKDLFSVSGFRVLIIFMILGIGMHLVTVGDARYKYPYIITMMLIIAPFLNGYSGKMEAGSF